jgi:glycosyltransferase involved in cell wall biosynthesis
VAQQSPENTNRQPSESSLCRVCHLSSVHNAFDTRILWKECVSLSAAGYKVCLIAAAKEDNVCQTVDIVPFPQFRHRLARFTFAPWMMLVKAMKSRADIYHFHDPELLPVGLLLRLLTWRPVIYDVHEDVSASIRVREYIPTFLREPLARGYRLLENVACRFLSVVIAEKYYADFLPRGVPILNYPILTANRRGATQMEKAENGEGRESSDLDNQEQPTNNGQPSNHSTINHTPPSLISDQCRHWLFYSGSVTRVRGALHHARLAGLVPNVGVYSAGRCDAGLADEMRSEARGATLNTQMAQEPNTQGNDPKTQKSERPTFNVQHSTNEQRTTDPPSSGLRRAGNEQASLRLVIEGEGVSVNRQRLDDLAMNYQWLAGLAVFPKTDHYRRKELTKFFEYMQAGIPILASNMPAWKTFVEGQGIGLTVDPEDPENQREKIQYLIDHPEERIAMGNRGRALVQTEYNWQTQADRLLALYADLLGAR